MRELFWKRVEILGHPYKQCIQFHIKLHNCEKWTLIFRGDPVLNKHLYPCKDWGFMICLYINEWLLVDVVCVKFVFVDTAVITLHHYMCQSG